VAAPVLIKILKDEKSPEPVRYGAVEVLGKIGPAAKGAVPVLIESLKNQNHVLRNKAVIALGKIGEEAGDAIPALKDALKDDDESIRTSAKWALSVIEK
jgi:HEAT repeat protein